MRGEHLPPCGARDQAVILADGGSIGSNARVRPFAGGKNRGKFIRASGERVGDRRAVSTIPRVCKHAEIVDRCNIVVSDQRADFNGLGNAAAPEERQPVVRCLDVCGAHQVEIAPVDRVQVAGMIKRRLAHFAEHLVVHARERVHAFEKTRLFFAVVAEFVGKCERKRDVRRGFGAQTERDQCDRHAQKIEILRNCGRGETGFDRNAGERFGKQRARRQYFEAFELRRCAFACANQTRGFAVCGKLYANGLIEARPMLGIDGGEIVGGHPDGEIRIGCDQRNRGNTINVCHNSAPLNGLVHDCAGFVELSAENAPAFPDHYTTERSSGQDGWNVIE